MTQKAFNIIWLTGMSGSGKSTLAEYVENYYKNKCKICIIDGDDVRDKDTEKLGFDYKDVLKNNLRIAKLCLKLKNQGFDMVLVPVISPYEEVRKKIRLILKSYIHLVYVKTDINSLKKRDTKGLYAAADKGVINDLIGYSDINPYDEPDNAEIIIDTSRATFNQSKDKLLNYIEGLVV